MGVVVLSGLVVAPSAASEAGSAASTTSRGRGGSTQTLFEHQPYCEARGGTEQAWIERVEFGPYRVRHSGDNGGYYIFPPRQELQWTAGDNMRFAGLPGYRDGTHIENWAMWIDTNHNGSFEESELLLSLKQEGKAEGEFLVPDLQQPTGLRIVMSPEAIAGPCGQWQHGEVEDYWLETSADRYCEARGTSSRKVWIETLVIDEYEFGMDHNGGYWRHSDDDMMHLPHDVTGKLRPGRANGDEGFHWALWADKNSDGVFGNEERLRSGSVEGDTETVDLSFSSPLLPKPTRLRVVVGLEPVSSPCREIANGEVEDFWATTAPLRPESLAPEILSCMCVNYLWEYSTSKWGEEIASYNVYLNGELHSSSPSPARAINWCDFQFPGTTYVVERTAVDTLGQESPRSAPIIVETPPCESSKALDEVRIVAVLVTLEGFRDEPYSTDAFHERLFGVKDSVHSYYNEVSFGLTELSGVVVGWYDLSGRPEDYCSLLLDDGRGVKCDTTALTIEAKNLAQDDLENVGYEPYPEGGPLMVVVNGTTDADSGITVGAGRNTQTLIHELGHKLGLDHAAIWGCPGPAVGPNIRNLEEGGCSYFVYGDIYDAMAVSMRHFNALNKHILGYIGWDQLSWAMPPSFVEQLPVTQEFELWPIELPTDGTVAVGVPLHQGDDSFYAVEYRMPVGYDAIAYQDPLLAYESGDPIQGVQVRLHIVNSPNYSTTQYIQVLLDEHEDFDDPYRRIRVEVVAPLGDTAKVRVTYYEGKQGEPCKWSEGCASGVCVDGYCCDRVCSGQCEACDVPQSQGQCVTVAGQPHGQRTPCAGQGETCGGQCDGVETESCVYPSAEVVCEQGSCVDGVVTPTRNCSGDGSCTPVEARECAPFLCQGESCSTSCSHGSQCADNAFCGNGLCTTKRATGRGCRRDEQCLSGNCDYGHCAKTAKGCGCGTAESSPGAVCFVSLLLLLVRRRKRTNEPLRS